MFRSSQLANSYQLLLNDFSSPELPTVGNYALGRLIGKGSFGKVYLASHKLTNGSKVVLKSTKKEDANLAREIHHHRQFLHPHIARLYEVIVTEHLVWLVLEWCPGDELYNYLLKHGRMEPAKVQKIFTQLVGAVSYVHAKGCVHRDLKLENILLDKHQNVKLVDFGFTREYKGSTSYLQTWCGTVCYSAPEMLRGEKYAGEKVDVWSLGVILYALLCGELPYDEDDDSATKALILTSEPTYPEYIPEPAKDLINKLLSKRPLLRPPLGDLLKDPWLSEFAPQQQEILKIQQPPPFSTQLEKDVLQRMRSAGVDIDMVIENVLSQRCDSLAGWWALLLEKEQRKEQRREHKRKERETEAKSLRRLSAASGRLLSGSSNLGEIHEGEEHGLQLSPRSRGRRMSRQRNSTQLPDLPKVTETKSLTPEGAKLEGESAAARNASRSRSRPPPPPKDYAPATVRKTRTPSRGSQSMLRVVANNPDLLSPSYVPPQQRKRRGFKPHPLKEQLAWVKQFFKDGTLKRSKAQNEKVTPPTSNPKVIAAGNDGQGNAPARGLNHSSTSPLPQNPSIGVENKLQLHTEVTQLVRPRINTTSSTGSVPSVRAKRTSLSPGTLTPHSSYRRASAGLRGRKSTSSSVSSIRSTYQAGHQHTHSKASSTSSASIASPSGLSSASGSRLGRSPHNSVKVLPSTPTNSNFPSGVRFARRPPPSDLGGLPPAFGEGTTAFSTAPPVSPGLPVFVRRKRMVFKGPMGGSPSGFGRTAAPGNSSRNASIQARPSTDAGIAGIEEEDEEAGERDIDEDAEFEEVDHFGPELGITTDVVEDDREGGEDLAGISPFNLRTVDIEDPTSASSDRRVKNGNGLPLTAEALAKMQHEEEEAATAASEEGKER